jgi:pilus assembly protein CpaB
MKARAIFIGLLVAGLGVALLALYMRKFEIDASGGPKVELLVAVSPIQRGKEVTAVMLGTKQVPQAYVDERAIRASEKDKVLNLRAVSNIPVLQTLTWTDFIAATDEQRDLSSLVQPGNRATPIRVQLDEVLQLIRPGDFVDVIGVFGEAQGATVLLQRVLVLATGLDTTVKAGSAQQNQQRVETLTVSVSLEEAQMLSLAQGAGKLNVVIRNPDDQRITSSPPDVTRSALADPTVRQTIQSARRRGPVKLEAEAER